MPAVSLLRYAQLAFCSKPKHERTLYREIKRLKAKRIVEVGMGNIARAVQMVSVAQRYSSDANISYTGLDWFDERKPGEEPMPLIHVHRQLQLSGARARLVPGFPAVTLPQVANSLQRTDLILLSHQIDDTAMLRAWFYMPRMCHSTTLVLREVRGDADTSVYESISLDQLRKLAEPHTDRIAA